MASTFGALELDSIDTETDTTALGAQKFDARVRREPLVARPRPQRRLAQP